MSLPIGTRLGPYEVIASLGAGGMGEVHLATDTRLDRRVAIKLLHTSTARSVSRDRFRGEARAVSSLNHPHICALYDIGEQDGRDYLVMEFLEGETLAQRLERGPLPIDQILRHAVEIANALDHAHRHGLVHRDLKPANVMLTKSGAKLLDFGLAKSQATPVAAGSFVTRTGERPLTEEGVVVGTLQYMAPEQLEGRAVDARTDLFAFGALLHEMVTGRKAFEGTSSARVMAAIIGVDPPPASTLQPRCPPALDRIVRKCLAKDPDGRWQTARDLADALRWISEDAQPVSSQMAAVEVPPSRRRRRAFAIAAIVSLVVLAAAGVWWWRQSRGSLRATDLRIVSTVSGEQWGASFSPDGHFIAFLKDVDGVAQVWVKNLVQGEPLQITSGEVPVRRLAWSPLNDRIVFSRFRAGLWSVPPLGGPAQRLIATGDAPSVSADGKRIVFTRGTALWLANADGTDVHEITNVPRTPWTIERSPAFSPDGQSIAFLHAERSPVAGDVWVIPAAGGGARRVTFDACESGWPTWTPDGRSIVYSSARAGSLTLWRVPAAGGAPEPLTTGAGEDTEPVISRDGTTLIYGTQRRSWSLILFDPHTGRETEILSRRTPVIFPALSPSGDRIVFNQPTTSGMHLHVGAADGSDVRQLTRGEGEDNVQAHWSSDGRWLYYYRVRPSKSYRKISVDGGASTELAAWDFLGQRAARIDPQSRVAVYTAMDGGQPQATVVHDLASGAEHKLARALSRAEWSTDSRTIFGDEVAADPAGNPYDRWVVVACPVDGQSCRTIARGFHVIPAADGVRLFYLRDTGADRSRREVWTVSVDGSNPRRFASIGPLAPDWEYDVSPSDQLLFNRLNASRRELWLAKLR